MTDEAFEPETVELRITPLPGQVADTIDADLYQEIENALRAAAEAEGADPEVAGLLQSGQIIIEKEFFLADGGLAVVVVVNLLIPIAKDTWRKVVIPWLRKYYQLEEKERPSRKTKASHSDE